MHQQSSQVKPQSGLSCEAKIALAVVGMILYGIMPIDFIPDVLPPITFVDDLGVVGAGIRYIMSVRKQLNDRDRLAQNVIDAPVMQPAQVALTQVTRQQAPYAQAPQQQLVRHGFAAQDGNGRPIDVEVIN